MSLHTGRIINRLHATKLPMPSKVIMRVEQLAKAQNMIPSLAFGNWDNRLIMQDIDDDNETEDAYIPTDEADSTLYYDQEAPLTQIGDDDRTSDTEENNKATHDDLPADTIQVDDIGTVSTVTNEMTTPTDTSNDQTTPLPDVDEEDEQNSAIQSLEEGIEAPMNTSHDENNQGGEQPSITPAITEDIVENTPDRPIDEEMDAKYGVRSTRWNLRQQKQRTYDHKYNEHAEIYVAQSQEATLATLQVPIRRGLKLFGSQGMKAVKAELQQLHDLKVMAAKPLTAIQKQKALGYLMFLK